MAYIRREHENDIYISEDRWIRWIEYDSTADDEFNAQSLLEEMQPFWKNMMLVCDSECCGIQAYDFSKKAVLEAVQGLNKTDVIKQLSDTKEAFIHSQNEFVSSRILNHYIKKDMFLELVDHLLDTLNNNKD